MRERGIFLNQQYVTRSADKSAMARSAQAMMASGQILLPATSEGDEWERELLLFPAGKDDHRVDTLANLCLRLETVWEATPPRPEPEETGTLSHELKVADLMPPRFTRKKSRYAMK
jgi:hypothetical protein